MNSHPLFSIKSRDEDTRFGILPDLDRLPKPSANEPCGWRQEKRREALHLLLRCCELWEEADRIGFAAVREKVEPAIIHAHDAFVQVGQPVRSSELASEDI
jgi:hypothetical protein